MPEHPKPPPPLPRAEVDKTVGVAQNQRRFDDPRRATTPGMPAIGVPTVPAPSRQIPEQARPTTSPGVPRAEEQAVFPPPITPAPPKPVGKTVVAEPETDEVVSWLVKRAIANRKAIYALVAAMGIGGGGVALKTATERPQPPPLTMAQLEQALDKQRTRKGGTDDQTRMLNELLQVVKCQRRKITQIGESVLPAPDHMGNARKPQPFEDDCPDNPRPLPEP